MAARPPHLIGESPLFHALLDRVSDLASLDYPVLVVGEAGTGKELMASRLHFLSPRWEQSYGSVNCAAYEEGALEELLFGRGDYSGRATVDGRLLSVDGGTMLLEQVETLPRRLQEKLARAISHGEFEPLGTQDVETVNVRFICTTSADLPLAVEQGTFSGELLDCLSFEVIRLPPLRSRFDDIAALAEHFGRKAAADLGAERFPGFTPEAIAHLGEQPWPGNVRELKTAVERSVANAYLIDETLALPVNKLRLDPFGRADRSAVTPLPASAPVISDMSETAENSGRLDFTERVMAFERGLIDQALAQHDHHQGHTADSLGLSYHQFRGLLRKHGLKK